MRKENFKNRNLIYAFKNAINGIIYTIRTQKNIKIQLAIAILVVIMSIYFGLTKVEYIALVFTMALVIFAETINTAVEKLADAYTEEYNEKIKMVKDIAAGAVLITSINAVIIGIIIFFERIIELL